MICATKPTPQLSRSREGSYRPRAAGSRRRLRGLMGLYSQHVESWHSLGGAAAPRVIVILAGLVDGQRFTLGQATSICWRQDSRSFGFGRPSPEPTIIRSRWRLRQISSAARHSSELYESMSYCDSVSIISGTWPRLTISIGSLGVASSTSSPWNS